MRELTICAVSDVHGHEFHCPPSDILISAGDMTMRGTTKEMEWLVDWFRKQPATHKLYIPGNHDINAGWGREKLRQDLKQVGTTLLVDEEITIEGLRIYGSPWTPCPGMRPETWAYPLFRGTPMAEEKWKDLPEGLDILVTHGPPHGISDVHYRSGEPLGCPELRKRLDSMPSPPKFHIFGHIHSGKKLTIGCCTTFCNASICDEEYQPVQKPIRISYGNDPPAASLWFARMVK